MGFAGLSVVAVSLFFVAAAISDLFTGTDNPGVMVGMAVLFGVTAFGGGLASYLGFRKAPNKELDPRNIERTILGVARDLQGEVTVEEVALNTPLTVAECKKLLDDMVSHGAAELGLGRNDETMYVFRGFLPGGKRTRSADPFASELDEVVFATQDQTVNHDA